MNKKILSMSIIGILMLITTLMSATAEIGVNWTEATASANWTARYSYRAIVFDGKMWVMGGNNGDPSYTNYNDVWYSTDGSNWTEATSNASWIPRQAFGLIAFDNKMWVMGGVDDLGNALNDVWYSTDGSNWTEATTSANWTTRARHEALTYDNKMWVMGGLDNFSTPLNDVWYSADGINWVNATNSASWNARSHFHALVFDNKMWIISGFNYGNDIWYSTDGENWTQTNNSISFSRGGHASVVINNKMWVMGGYDGNYKNDVWYSDDGIIWTQATTSADWSVRSYFRALNYDNKTWVLGGSPDGGTTALNDVWYSEVSAISCSVCNETCSPCGGGCTATDMTSMFAGVTDFDTTIGDITAWNTSCITSMLDLFYNSDFNQAIGSWDTSSVTDMSFMFYGDVLFNQDISLWNTSNVLYMNDMFNNAFAFNQDISTWDTSSVTTTNRMFNTANAFNQPLGTWDMSSVTDMDYMFVTTPLFNQNLTTWDTSSVTTMQGVFADSNFNGDISGWDTSSVTTMVEMFYANPTFNQNIGMWDISQVSDMTNMFLLDTLPTTTYDAILNGWSNQIVQNGVTFFAGNSQYSNCTIGGGEAGKNILSTNYSWSIYDGGQNTSFICPTNCTPNWTCDTYGSCNSSNIMPCNSMADINFCGESFTGNIKDYDMNCTYPTSPIIYREANDVTGATIDTGVKMIVGFKAIAFLFGIVIASVGIAFAFRKLIIKK